MNQPLPQYEELPPAAPNPPIFNIPGAVLLLAVVLSGIQAVRTYGLDGDAERWVIIMFSFLPITYTLPVNELYEPMSRYWSPVTYALLHADWTHLLVNGLWMLAFGSAVARRFGNMRFWAFFVLSSAAAALAHYLLHMGSATPVIGASGAVSAFMGAAMRFAFRPGGMSDQSFRTPALSLMQSLKNRSVLTFAIFWLVFNFLIGSGVLPIAGGYNIAWEAHMGGFLFGWLAFGLFDRQP